jgi:hypothetical protein
MNGHAGSKCEYLGDYVAARLVTGPQFRCSSSQSHLTLPLESGVISFGFLLRHGYFAGRLTDMFCLTENRSCLTWLCERYQTCSIPAMDHSMWAQPTSFGNEREFRHFVASILVGNCHVFDIQNEYPPIIRIVQSRIFMLLSTRNRETSL